MPARMVEGLRLCLAIRGDLKPELRLKLVELLKELLVFVAVYRWLKLDVPLRFDFFLVVHMAMQRRACETDHSCSGSCHCFF